MKIISQISLLGLLSLCLLSCETEPKKPTVEFVRSKAEVQAKIKADSLVSWVRTGMRGEKEQVDTLGFDVYFSGSQKELDERAEMFKNHVHEAVENIADFDFLSVNYYNNGQINFTETEQLSLF